ncbi:uncharacterized protein LY79DRAFT_570239 [Colletotrichum navitas]|uniref:Uncharacterized protein n=1 Tax=Colletotrichum navitas TaxID=681940 RepID=A0AAD8PMP3_9PEZI|nr:uncharacterized protein LY79DRAFT_570239 [Colletotrichum navitas]KAK1570217.1 hypothetical protein LY79DRAFT_570239 [Colletotrichum navitas]
MWEGVVHLRLLVHVPVGFEIVFLTGSFLGLMRVYFCFSLGVMMARAAAPLEISHALRTLPGDGNVGSIFVSCRRCVGRRWTNTQALETSGWRRLDAAAEETAGGVRRPRGASTVVRDSRLVDCGLLTRVPCSLRSWTLLTGSMTVRGCSWAPDEAIRAFPSLIACSWDSDFCAATLWGS